jgi:hypothetical protein
MSARQPTDEIAITDEMTEAALAVYERWLTEKFALNKEPRGVRLVKQIYMTMLRLDLRRQLPTTAGQNDKEKRKS